MVNSTRTERVKFLHKARCPHCWKSFAPEDSRWISVSPDLLGDEKLGDVAQRRFLPTRFSVDGNAIDVKGQECQELACPNCHLGIPRVLLSFKPFYVSIAGTPACGKSYFLASMTWQMRHTMPSSFCSTFGDADPLFNKILNAYEEQQFLNPDQDKIVKLAKTQEFGDMYSEVRLGTQTYSFPQPFLFLARPSGNHPSSNRARNVSRTICLYDNAGESYQAGKDTVTNQVTRHLGVANSIIYCFDPTQDPRFRNAAKKASEDHQMVNAPVTARQENVLYELIQRVRRHASLSEDERTKKPLFVVCTKYDAWHSLLGIERFETPIIRKPDRNISTLDLPEIKRVSEAVRDVIIRFSPELVAAAESFAENVFFVPVSATGVAPQQDKASGFFGVRPSEIDPMWCDIPMLVSLAMFSGGLIPYRSAAT